MFTVAWNAEVACTYVNKASASPTRKSDPVTNVVIGFSRAMRMASAIVEATAHFDDASLVAKVSRGLGAPMAGVEITDDAQRLAQRGW